MVSISEIIAKHLCFITFSNLSLLEYEEKNLGARFRKFDNPKDASDFLDNLANDSLSQFSFTTSSRPASSNGPVEPVIPHKAVTKIEMNALKRAIDKDEVETFK